MFRQPIFIHGAFARNSSLTSQVSPNVLTSPSVATFPLILPASFLKSEILMLPTDENPLF